MQMTHQEPAVLYAVIAIGFVHRQFAEKALLSINTTRCQDPRTLISLKQYVKAIESLRSRITNLENPDSFQVALLTCLLFIYLKMMRGQQMAALTHLGTGLRILSSSKHIQYEGPNVLMLKYDSESILDQLISIFARLDNDSTMSGQRCPHFLLHPHQSSTERTLIPPSFANITQARQYLDVLTNRVLRLRGQLLAIAVHSFPDITLDIPTRLCWEHATTRAIDLSSHPAILSELRSLQDHLAIWSSALDAFKNTHRFSENVGLSASNVLEIQHFYSYFLISNCQTTREKYCDSFGPLFKKIVNLADVYILETASAGRRVFTLESGVLLSLYLIAMKCRHPETRRRAITLLGDALFQAGMWEAQLIAHFVARIADLEEARASHGSLLVESGQTSEQARFCDMV